MHILHITRFKHRDYYYRVINQLATKSYIFILTVAMIIKSYAQKKINLMQRFLCKGLVPGLYRDLVSLCVLQCDITNAIVILARSMLHCSFR